MSESDAMTNHNTIPIESNRATPEAFTQYRPLRPCPLCGVPTSGVRDFLVPLCPQCRSEEQAAIHARITSAAVAFRFPTRRDAVRDRTDAWLELWRPVAERLAILGHEPKRDGHWTYSGGSALTVVVPDTLIAEEVEGLIEELRGRLAEMRGVDGE